MMRILLPATLLVLAGCTVVPPQAYSYDPTHPQPRAVADPVAIAPLTNRVAQLQVELNDVRGQIALQADSWKRLPLYEQEHAIHGRLDPLQHELGQYAQAH